MGFWMNIFSLFEPWYSAAQSWENHGYNPLSEFSVKNLFLSETAMSSLRRLVIIEGSCSEVEETVGWNSGDIFTQQTLAERPWCGQGDDGYTKELLKTKETRMPPFKFGLQSPAQAWGFNWLFNKCLLNQVNLATNSQVNVLLQSSDATSFFFF